MSEKTYQTYTDKGELRGEVTGVVIFKYQGVVNVRSKNLILALVDIQPSDGSPDITRYVKESELDKADCD